jgi:glycosyltransferase involved in cell wall biosynthesis
MSDGTCDKGGGGNMKKICFLIDSIFSIGGVQRVTAVIAKELAKNYDVAIVTFDKQEAMDTSLYALDEAKINYRFFKYPQIGYIRNKICKAYSGFYQKYRPQSKWASDLYGYSSFPYPLRKALINELRAGKYDVIIGVHAPLAGRLATIKKSLPGIKTIGWIHNSFEALFGDQFIYIGSSRKRHYVYQFKKLDRVVLLCQHDAASYYQYDRTFIPAVIYNPLTLQPGKPSEGLSKRFLAIGRFSKRHKGFDLLIEAFNLFAKDNHDWILDIVGEGREEKIYRELIEKYDLGQRIRLHPFTKYVQDYYSKAQIYVLSSRWEGFGLVLVEAMAHGLPVVSSDLPTSKEIMGDFGQYFESGNIEDLAQKLEEATHLDWQQKSLEALDIAQKFNIETIIEQWKQLIEE